jgi:hypothetical protein
VPIEELIDIQLHFLGRILRSERLQTVEKMRVCADSVKSREKSARADFFVSEGHALFDFSVKIIFCAREFFCRFFSCRF